MTTADNSDVPAYENMLRLDGRGIVVLGAGQGIGRQAAHALSRNGAKVVCVDLEEDRAGEIAEEVGGIAWSGDVTRRDDVRRLGDEAEKELGRIDGLVDIVGIARWAEVLDITDEDWDWAFDMVVRHAYLASQELGRRMVASGGGTMAFVASVSGITGAPMHAAYGAAKASLMAWVRSLAVELGPQGVRANAVAPGAVWTPRIAAMQGPDGQGRSAENAPLRRVALPADIASALLFLTSDLSSYVNGQTLIVDGGVSAKFPYGL